MTTPKNAKPPGATSSHGDTRTRGEKVNAVCQRIRKGTAINHACAIERVTRSAFYEWLEKDEEIAAQVGEARAHAAELLRRRIVRVALGHAPKGANANALLHLLERGHPDEYSPPKTRVETTGANGGPVRYEGKLEIEGLKRIARGKKDE